jgi:EAL and modified HD-GYP domain-containing signal transduction protein
MIAGMVSGLDSVLNIEMEDLLEQISLSSEINNAISKGEGDIGKVLYNAINFSLGEWDSISKDIDESVYSHAYMDSIEWVNETLQAIDDQ